MTSIPKPLKFLRSHYDTLEACFKGMVDFELKKLLADILSLVAFTMSDEHKNECLLYRLLGSEGDLGVWGHAYIRNLTGEIIADDLAKKNYLFYKIVDTTPTPIPSRLQYATRRLLDDIIAFYMENKAEPEAVDLLMETGSYLSQIVEHINPANYERACLYLTSTAKYACSRYEFEIPKAAFDGYLKCKDYPRALQIALHLDDMESVKEVLTSCPDLLSKKQLLFIIGRHGISFDINKEMHVDDEERKCLEEIIGNAKLSECYLALARDIGVMEPKTPANLVKIDEEESTTHNLGAIYLNAFVNAGFGQDKLMTVQSSRNEENWLIKNNPDGKTSAVATLGLIFLWNIHEMIANSNSHYQNKDASILSGALLGIGIASCNTKNKFDPASALLTDNCNNEDPVVQISAIMGLGLAYAGQQNDKVRSILTCLLKNPNLSVDVKAFSAISLALAYVGSGHICVAKEIISALERLEESDLDQPIVQLMILGVGLVYLGKKKNEDAWEELSDQLNEKIKSNSHMIFISCVYAGTGDQHHVHRLLSNCKHHAFKDKVQGSSVLGIAMVALGDKVAQEMSIRLFEHLLQYSEQNIRRVVPLALGLLCISDPKINVMDTLSRLSHDDDEEVVMGSILALGLIGAGTNNGRIAGKLRKLARDNYNIPDVIFCARIAHGLLCLGKGLLTLSPCHSDQFLLSPVGLAGLTTVLHACLDMESMLGKFHRVLFYIVLAIQPRMLMTLDDTLEPTSVAVQVGTSVDDDQAGRSKYITGSRTLSTPAILAAGERAVVDTERYVPLSPFLEGFVIVKENPNYRE